MSIAPLTLNEVFESSKVMKPLNVQSFDEFMYKEKLCVLPFAEYGLV